MNNLVLERFLIALLLIWITVLTIFVCDNRMITQINTKQIEVDKQELETEMALMDSKHERDLIKQEQVMTAIIKGREGEW